MLKKKVSKETEELFASRLESYFEDRNLKDEKIQEVIKRVIGKPEYSYDQVMDEVDEECQETYYDADFESVLDNYSNILHLDNAASLFDDICGYWGGTILYLLEDLGMIEVKTN